MVITSRYLPYAHFQTDQFAQNDEKSVKLWGKEKRGSGVLRLHAPPCGYLCFVSGSFFEALNFCPAS